MKKLSIGLIIPSRNAQETLGNILTILKDSPIEFSTLIVDSSSDDKTVSIAKSYNAQVIVIPQADFNHGTTREYARKQLATDIVVFLTQDAIPASADLIAKLVKPLIEQDSVVVSYGRQVAHKGAGVFEAFPREYNYGDVSQLRCINDVDQYGVYTFFCSNSCAAYKNTALDEMGGFQATLVSEDYLAVVGLLQKGYKIAYAADAIVSHSHSYTLRQEFQRYFDTGYVREENPVIQTLVGQSEFRGIGFVTALLHKIWLSEPVLIPYALIQSILKWLGYRIGFYSARLPSWLVKKLSMQPYYWTSKYFRS